MTKSPRYHSLDLLRAVMMALGIVFHGVQMYYVMLGADDYYRDPMRSLSMDAMLIIINTFRMPVFFMLSGFFVALLLARRGPADMLRNRFDRIVLPFIVFLPVTALVMTPLTVLGRTYLATGAFGFDMSTVPADAHLYDKTHNLWFLYYLAMFVGASTIIAPLLKTISDRLTIGAMSQVKMVTLFALLLGGLGSLSDSGRVSADLSFIPSALTFGYFFVCYLFGWLLYSDQASITLMAVRVWTWLALALVAFVIALIGFGLRGEDSGSAEWMIFHAVLSLSTGFSVVGFMLFFTGLFERFCNSHSELGRYFSDSAYWVFLSHSFFLVAFAIPMAHLSWPAEVKFLIVATLTSLCCWISYDWFVRPTFIGKLLNGKRMPRRFFGKRD